MVIHARFPSMPRKMVSIRKAAEFLGVAAQDPAALSMTTSVQAAIDLRDKALDSTVTSCGEEIPGQTRKCRYIQLRRSRKSALFQPRR